jgi:predicted DNA binding CopG/RHH family protein
MARRKKISDEEFMNQAIDIDSVVRIQGKVPGRTEAVSIAKMKKESRFTARVSQKDFEDFKKISAKKGIGYQTLLGSIIHQYINGGLVDVEEIRKAFPNLKLKIR